VKVRSMYGEGRVVREEERREGKGRLSRLEDK